MRRILALLGIMILAGTMAFYAPAHAAEPTKKVPAATATAAAAPTLKGIGVVDVMVLMRDSKAANSIEKQLDDRRKTYRDSLSAQEKKLRATEDSLIKERGKLKPEEFDTKRKAFEKSVRELQQSAQKKRFALDQAAARAVGTLQNEITKITAEIAAAKKLQLVLTRDQVVIVGKSLDITSEVMTKLNEKMSSVSVKIEEPKAAAAPKAEKK